MNKESHFTVTNSEAAVEVVGEFWRVRHERRRGGCVADIRIRYGSDTNLLSQVSAAVLDRWSEAHERHPVIHIKRLADGVELRVTGHLCDAEGRPGPVRFGHTYHYTPWSIRHELTLSARSAVRTQQFCPTSVAFADPATHYVWGTSDFVKAKPRYMHIVGPHYDDMMDEVPGRAGLIQEDASRPWNVAFIRRGIEGLQWCGDSSVYAWDEVSPHRAFRLTRTRAGIEFEPRLVSGEASTLLGRKLTLGWYWFLPNIRRLGRRRFNEVVVQTNPFPTEEMLDTWQGRGVDLLRIHNDSDATGADAYWHDGRHPPFGPAKMKQMAAFLRAAHRRGMKVVPYFSGWELSPDTPLFAQHADEWFAPSQPGGKKRYTPNAGAGVYGGIMCPDSGWSEALERNIRAAIDEFGFDGFYLDWSSPLPCFNERHRPGQHNGIDGLHGMLTRLRRQYPDKLIIIHSGGQLMWLFHHNLADQYVTLEEGKKEGGFTPETPEEYPVTADYMGVGPASAVPDIYLGTDRTKLYRGLVHAALLGVPPYTYVIGCQKFGYADWREEAADPRGILAMMAKYARVDWLKYHFYSAATGIAQSARAGVGVAVYVGERDGILVAGNLRDRPASAFVATVQLDRTCFGGAPVRVSVPALEGWEWRFVRFSVP
ncbi:MAG: DUF6259 domain-containing protein [Verrucomicrobiota bacterium]|jgi:hypothetical protein